MAEKKHFLRRRSYLEDFQKNVNGEYVYTGAAYTFASANGMSRRQALGMLWLFGGILLVCAVVPGCVPAGSMLGCAYVLLPYGGMLIGTVCALWALARLSVNRDPLRAYIYKSTVEALPGRSLLAFIFSAAALVGQLIYLFSHGFGDGLSLLVLVLFAADGASSFLFYRTARMLKWEKVTADTSLC